MGILVGDVSGKGVPAALTMAQLLAQFRVYARSIPSPAEVLKMLNADLVLRSRQGMFCTLCYITLDLATGKLLCANAGHHPAVHINGQGAKTFGEASGPPAGVSADAAWVDTEGDAEPDDVLVLYTDGIVEARKADTTEEYGAETLQRLVGKLHGCSPKSVVGAVLEDVVAHCAPAVPHDDCTMIALRRLGNR